MLRYFAAFSVVATTVAGAQQQTSARVLTKDDYARAERWLAGYTAPLVTGGVVRPVWLSNEAPGVVPGLPTPPHQGRPFVLARDGHTPIALTDPHGTWLRWLAPG